MNFISQMPITSTNPELEDFIEEALEAELFKQFIEIAVEHHAAPSSYTGKFSTIDGVWDDCHYLMKRVDLRVSSIVEHMQEQAVDVSYDHDELQDFLWTFYDEFPEEACCMLDCLEDDINCELLKLGFPIYSNEDDDCEDCDDDDC